MQTQSWDSWQRTLTCKKHAPESHLESYVYSSAMDPKHGTSSYMQVLLAEKDRAATAGAAHRDDSSRPQWCKSKAVVRGTCANTHAICREGGSAAAADAARKEDGTQRYHL